MQTLKDSEIRYRRLFEAAQDGILILDAKTGAITDVNPFLIKMLGYSREEFAEKKLWEVGAFKDIEASQDDFETLQKNEYIRYEDLPLKTKDGRLVQVEFISSVYLVGNEKVIQCNIRDITEHKRILAALQENEKKYHDLVNQSPDGIFIIESSGNILTVNKAMCKELGFSEEEFLSMNIWDIIPDQYLDQYRERLTKILAGESLKGAAEYTVRGKDGKNHYVEVISAPHYSGKDIIGFQGIARDVTARKRVEESLLESEERFRELVAHLPTVVYLNALGDAISTTYVSPQIETLMGYTPQEWIANPKLWSETLHPEDRQRVLAQATYIDQSNKPFDMEYRMIARDGHIVWVHDRVTLVKDLKGQPQFWQGIMLDITERKLAEESLRTSEERFRTMFEQAPLGIALIGSLTGHIYEVNPRFAEIAGRSMEEMTDIDWMQITHPDDVQADLDNMALLNAGKINGFQMEKRYLHPDGTAVWVNMMIAPLKVEDKGHPRHLCMIEDITERKRAEERIKRQVEQLTAMIEIDRMITSSFDLRVNLNAIVDRVISQQKVDAAAILIMDPYMNTLEFNAGRGFHTLGIEKGHLSLNENYAGRAVLERKTIHIADLRAQVDNPLFKKTLVSDNFVSYYAVPLIAKGKVKGVLEVFHRSPLDPDFEWLEFLNTLAGQAALAIDSATLFGSLQRSNTELSLAYDATIEGWSRALDLRDKETEGHTQRVTKMTVDLARAFGLSEAELVQVRWGSLLHDIGKMGVPDGILLKPGLLTDEEWVEMKKHPAFAYELLSPIRFLRLALDIPYCHHEKWDGSGYPRRLMGEQIPLAARIFAVIDVWDALTSDRVYRPAWTKEKVREHIRTSSGTHFDPQVVDVFLRMMDNE